MSVLSAIGDYISDHKSEIAFGAGVVLTGATTVLAVNATPKAMDAIKEKTEEKGEELTFWEKVKTGWKHYILPAATEVLGLTCLFYGKSIDMKATGAALALADASQKLLRTYTEKVVEEIGEKKEEEIRRSAAEDCAKEDFATYKVRPSEDTVLINGDSWYYSDFLGKKFISSKTKIDAAVNVVNSKLNSGEDVALDDFFGEIYDASTVPINHELFSGYGDSHGFVSEKGLIDVKTNPTKIVVNGVETPAFTMWFVYQKTWSTIDELERIM